MNPESQLQILRVIVIYGALLLLPIKSVFFIRHRWQKWTEICHKILFQSQSVCDSNTSIGTKVLRKWGSEPIKLFRWYSLFRDGRELVEDDHPKSTRTEINIATVADFFQKWQSNRIKNDSRVFEHPQDCSSSDSERGFGKEKVVYTSCSTLLDIWAKGRSIHILPSCDGRCRQFFF